MTIKAMRHAGIVVKDLKNQLYFYKDILGLKIKQEMLEAGEFIDNIFGLKGARIKTVKMSSGNGSLIELVYFFSCRGKKIKRRLSDKGFSHIAFTIDDIDKEYKRLQRRGIKFISLPQVSLDGKVKAVFLNDPEGNLIELVEELKEKS